MKFDHKLMKQVRVNELKISRDEFCRRVNEESSGKFALTRDRLMRFENTGSTYLSPNEFGVLYRVLKKNADYFYKEDKQKGGEV